MVYEWPWEKEKLSEIWNWPVIQWINIFGLWAEEASSPSIRSILRKWRIFSLAGITTMAITIFLDVVMKYAEGDYPRGLFGTFTFIACLCSVYKIIEVVRHRRSLRMVMDTVDELTKEICHPDDVSIYRQGMVRTWAIFISTMATLCFAEIHWWLRPIVLAIVFHERTVILDAWPVFTDTWTQFSLTYIFQVIIGLPIPIGYASFDWIFFCVSQSLLAHFSVIQNQLKRLHLNRNNTGTAELNGIIEYHIRLLKACKGLTESSVVVVIMKALDTMILWCFGLYVFLMSDIVEPNMLINIFEVLTAIGLYLTLFCSYCHEIKIQCWNVGTAAYMGKWLSGSEEEKKTLLVLMRRANTPAMFGGFVRMDLSTFLGVIKTAFSYFNFLLAVMGKRQ